MSKSDTSKLDEIIFAPASIPAGGSIGLGSGAALAIIRISGAGCHQLIAKMLKEQSLPPPRELALRNLYHPSSGALLDQAMLVRFAAPASFSGEDMVELHCHGGAAVLASITDALGGLPARPAEPGEFTRRAVLGGKLDLLAAEAVADLIAAEGAAQSAQALAQMGGALSRLFADWRTRLTQILAHIEADIEFADEDISEDKAAISTNALAELPALRAEMAEYADDRRGLALRDGLRIVLSGAPNVGKSSLLNALADKPAAIVNAAAGTTRDIIEVPMMLVGVPCILVDTAGIHESADNSIEKEGILRAEQQAENADICLKIISFDTDSPLNEPKVQKTTNKIKIESGGKTENSVDNYNQNDNSQNPAETALNSPKMHQITLKIANKADIDPKQSENTDDYDLKISAKTGAGIDNLLKLLENTIKTEFLQQNAANLPNFGESAILTRQRHRDCLYETINCLDRALAAQSAELIAEDIRLAHRTLARISGEVDIESLLDVVFNDFCIGK